jgi:nuclease HARBI1
MYSGHKRCHGIKFQSIVTPDGLFASMYGSVNGNLHDSFLLSTSGLLDKLWSFMPDLPGTVVFSLYGDPAYPQSIYIFGGYKNPLNGSTHALWNTTMSKVCEVVEWGFADILSQCSFLDFRAGMKVFRRPVAKYYNVGAFLVNLQFVFLVIKPWFILTVRLSDLINTCC